ncbi:hypothetical protein PROFUN_04517 [Planoprotostelium fungivorum]|uniref:SAP domain-containing protein n=1 Tax=Planoprotostelium fungivorum TaxID=1890364 RepID=A0A2P6NBC7_9EUKA|nr:hypothetical protein PROFUN_04495 [Planoprotostelium fungivorum]PRP81282.1 hypothetical protein PROFUN_04517 [Planoprotostelium fungivorum]
MATIKQFKSFNEEQIDRILEKDKYDPEDFKTKTKKVQVLSKEATDMGIELIIGQLKLQTLKDIAEDLPEIQERLEKKSQTKATLTKYIREFISENPKHFFDNASIDLLAIILEAIDVVPSKDNALLADQALQTVQWEGIQAFLSRFDVAFLKGLCEELGLECETDSIPRITAAIASMEDAEKGQAPDTTITFSKKKLPIAPGVTYQDIYQHYFLDELVDYCAQNQLVKSGTKKQVINRILASFEEPEDKENAKPNKKVAEKSEKAKKVEKTETSAKSSKKSVVA